MVTSPATSLFARGLAVGTATAGVLTHRLISVVLVVAAGWIVWFALHAAKRDMATDPAKKGHVRHYLLASSSAA